MLADNLCGIIFNMQEVHIESASNGDSDCANSEENSVSINTCELLVLPL